MTGQALRQLPSIDQWLRREALQPLIAAHGREVVRDRLREVITELRGELRAAEGEAAPPHREEALDAEIERRVQARFERRRLARTQRVINATGVVLHTNLGRAPLSGPALDAIREVAADYCNLEYDLETGARGRRGAGLEQMVRELLGVEAVAVANNCAAAVLLTLNTLAEGGEVLVSRGELIEIGGSFRIPDVIAKSGARLREVGTTNRTRIADYEKAINENTRVILRAHPSNYRIVGFTEQPSIEELAGLARKHGLPLFDDLGSGCWLGLDSLGIHDEPTIERSIRAGASVIGFSGDKLLGGPQAGLLLGDAALIRRIQANPLMRALRVDKLVFAALEATLASYAAGRAKEEIPVVSALFAAPEELDRRARAFVRRAKRAGLPLQLIPGHSVVGGGSAPDRRLPATLIRVPSERASATALEARLRAGEPPIVARILDDALVLDLRTVRKESEGELLEGLRRGTMNEER